MGGFPVRLILLSIPWSSPDQARVGFGPPRVGQCVVDQIASPLHFTQGVAREVLQSRRKKVPGPIVCAPLRQPSMNSWNDRACQSNDSRPSPSLLPSPLAGKETMNQR
ncbi:uncharacterized protein BO80DRAFT_278381 [Aspergillus ibericus CBS 121593]|uniref:Uncharacterized protein n=1 Tax=Aspergillus ibericus CBS 121593 TaxID=1448316 RepID=A0A395GI74_9EURO|nr:hypothetical protein BO80DRAFT_278381 [Aspergillus ibericus CBS 121593]RAK95129.1 hypothetical protein BO80DRAFT_278381 [Aspergillus ibericus CBS 121593]